MSELPDRPDLDQLRRQARELLRAAAGGEPRAITRLRAVSGRVTLSAAQLAIAREHGCPSWPALGAEVRRRRRMLESAGRQVQGAIRRMRRMRRQIGGLSAGAPPSGRPRACCSRRCWSRAPVTPCWMPP